MLALFSVVFSKDCCIVVLLDISEIFEELDGCYIGGEATTEVQPNLVPKSHKPYRAPEAIKSKVKAAVDQLIEEVG